jgi:hypothetical protein
MLATTGCGGSGDATPGGHPGANPTGGASTSSGGSGGGYEAPDFPEGQGQAPIHEEAYPAGPYGVGIGSVMPNLQFVGVQNTTDQSQKAFHFIQLADFYNPTGNDTYPEGSPYGAGNAKPTVLLIDVASVWCGPCNYEAQNILPAKYKTYAPRGGEFLLQLADGPTPGIPATTTNLLNWAKKYKVEHPASIDPANKLEPYWDADAYPENFIIDTKTMKIVRRLAGAPIESLNGMVDPDGVAFWKTFEKYLKPAQ